MSHEPQPSKIASTARLLVSNPHVALRACVSHRKVYDCSRHFSCMLPHPPTPSTLVVLKHTSMAQSQQVPSLVTFKNSLIRTARQPLYKAL
jgi:hypothetical protein